MEERNPFAPPKARIDAVRDTACTREGDIVVLKSGNDLPPRCIVCNAPAEMPVKEVRLYWHSPWFYLLIIVNLLVYLLVALIARRSAKVSPGLCADHHARRRRLIGMFLMGGAVTVAASVGLVLDDQADLAIAGFVLAFALLVVGMISTREVYAKSITADYVRLGGCKKAFLSSLD